MKNFIAAAAVLACLSASAQIGAENIMKQRAHNVVNQNNTRNVEPGTAPAPAAPAPAAPTPAPAPQLNSAQQAYAHFQTDLLAVNENAAAGTKDQLGKDMMAVAQGANKPTQPTLSKLSDHLTAALGEAKLVSAKKTRVAQEVAVILNSAATPAQKQAMIKDVQSILEAGGTSTEHAAAVAADLQSVADEIQKTAAK